MGLLSFFGRKPAPGASTSPNGDEARRARVRARQRLIGAIVLVGLGILAFPVLFETQPRPIPVDIPINIADRDSAEPLTLPAERQSADAAAASASVEAPAPTEPVPSGPIPPVVLPPPNTPLSPPASSVAPAPPARPPSPPSAVQRPTSAPAPVRSEAPARRPVEAAAPRASAPVAQKPSSRADRQSAEAERARALLEGREVAAAPARPAVPAPPAAEAAASTRFIVQIGAYAEAASARDMRQKVERLGHKTYTQVVQTSAGSRIRVRVGPFDTRAEADRTATTLRSAGLPAAVMSL